MQETPNPVAAASVGLDIDSIETIMSADYELRHPVTDAPTGAFITLAGPEHPKRKQRLMDQLRRMRAAELRRGPAVPKDPEEDFRRLTEDVIAVTLGWRGITKNGVAVPFSEAAAAELYADPKRQWVVQQLIAAMNDQQLFIKA